jgi:hypothetical protein
MAGRITFSFLTMQWGGITFEQVEIWQHLYPDINVPLILKVAIPRWIDRHIVSRQPLKVHRIAQKRDWKKTIVNWLKKEQIKAVGL